MAVVETERHGQILIVRMNRPERLNALSGEMRTKLAEMLGLDETKVRVIAPDVGGGFGAKIEFSTEDVLTACRQRHDGRHQTVRDHVIASGHEQECRQLLPGVGPSAVV